jgi:hypothetical protein
MRIPRSLHRLLSCLGPYQSLLILAIPLAIVEPPKLVALFVVGEGHFVAGVLIMIFAYEGSLFVIERLFLVLKPKLLTLLAMVRDRSRQASFIGLAERGRECGGLSGRSTFRGSSAMATSSRLAVG